MIQENGLYKPTKLEVETAKENGVSKSTLLQRLNVYGWTIERAINEPTNKKGNHSKKYTKEQLEIANKNGISMFALSCRVNAYGWSVEDAISIPLNKRRPKVILDEFNFIERR